MTRIKCLVGTLFVAAVGCSASNDSEGGSPGVPNELNLCATEGATCLATYTELSGGNCGSISPQVLNTNDPSITSARCASVTQANCVAQGTACKSSSDGCNSKMTYKATFAEDGSSATSISTITVDCSDGSYCQSTYDVSMVRQ